MKKFIYLLIAILCISITLISCDEVETGNRQDVINQQNSANILQQNQPTPTDIEYSLERYNLIRRTYWVNGMREKANTLPCEVEKPFGYPNHLLVNKVMDYPIDHFLNYCRLVSKEMKRRGFRTTEQSHYRIECLGTYRKVENLFDGWHDKQYLRCNMGNLWEKHFKAVGKSRITDEEWQTLLDGYKQITGEEYKI